MDKKGQERLLSALPFLRRATDIIQKAANEEEQAYYNLPDHLVGSERGKKMCSRFVDIDFLAKDLREVERQIKQIVEDSSDEESNVIEVDFVGLINSNK